MRDLLEESRSGFYKWRKSRTVAQHLPTGGGPTSPVSAPARAGCTCVRSVTAAHSGRSARPSVAMRGRAGNEVIIHPDRVASTPRRCSPSFAGEYNLVRRVGRAHVLGQRCTRIILCHNEGRVHMTSIGGPATQQLTGGQKLNRAGLQPAQMAPSPWHEQPGRDEVRFNQTVQAARSYVWQRGHPHLRPTSYVLRR